MHWHLKWASTFFCLHRLNLSGWWTKGKAEQDKLKGTVTAISVNMQRVSVWAGCKLTTGNGALTWKEMLFGLQTTVYLTLLAASNAGNASSRSFWASIAIASVSAAFSLATPSSAKTTFLTWNGRSRRPIGVVRERERENEIRDARFSQEQPYLDYLTLKDDLKVSTAIPS